MILHFFNRCLYKLKAILIVESKILDCLFVVWDLGLIYLVENTELLLEIRKLRFFVL